MTRNRVIAGATGTAPSLFVREQQTGAHTASRRGGRDVHHNAAAEPSGRPAVAIPDGAPTTPSISLPKGGGAIRGIGEKFANNPVTGTGTLSVPLATSVGRSGFGPSLTLAYDSGGGNSPFGMGWDVSLPAITRKTDKGLPRYYEEPEDTFVLSGAEDLVPVLEHRGRRTVDGREYTVQRYRPRIEGLFARIERWTDRDSGDTHWRSITPGNVTTLYGTTSECRIADPDDATRVFTWLIAETYDDSGNAVVYEYKAENGDGVDIAFTHERHRLPSGRTANRYLKRVKYGNRVSRLIEPDLSRAEWLFETVFDYGEHDLDDPRPAEAQPWRCRLDPFSTYRAGFEVRTYRLCRRVLMFHHFPEEDDVGRDCLVSSTELTYRDDPIASFMESVIRSGYRRRQEGGYRKKSLPPLEFTFSRAVIDDQLRSFDPESLENLPAGLDGTAYQWVDLDGEGLSGLLTEQADAWFYKANLGDGRFGPIGQVAAKPSLAALHGGRQELMDLAGDGQLDLVDFGGPTPGFYERSTGSGWKRFRPFPCRPDISWNDPNLRFVDLTGDGHADVLISGDDLDQLVSLPGRVGIRTGSAHLPSAGRGARATAGHRRRGADGLRRRHVRRRARRSGADPQRRGLLLAQPRLRPVRRPGGDGRCTAVRRGGPLRPAAAAHRRYRRLRRQRPHLPTPRRHADLLQPRRQQLERTAQPYARVPTHRQRQPGHHRRSARQRHRMPRLVLAAAHRRRPGAALCRPDGRPEATPAHRGSQQSRRRNPHPLRAVDPLLCRGQSSRAALGHQAAVPGARRRARRDARSDQPQPLRHALRLSPRSLRRGRARVSRIRHGRADRHRALRGAERRGLRTEYRRGHACAAGADPHLVPHRSVHRATCRGVLPRGRPLSRTIPTSCCCPTR